MRALIRAPIPTIAALASVRTRPTGIVPMHSCRPTSSK